MPDRRLPVVRQLSAGGVVYRGAVPSHLEVALIRVGPKDRWQLPKGMVDKGETPEITAIREVREETGVDAELVGPLDVIEYWYAGNGRDGRRVRFHKFVHLFLLRYTGGDVGDHDSEVEEARWFTLDAAEGTLSFASERKAMAKAASLLGEPD